MQGERDDSSTKVTRLESEITELQRMLNHAHAAARAANKENTTARAKEKRIWYRVREEEVKRMRAEEASSELQEQVEGLQQQLSARSQKGATERQELSNFSFRCKAYAEKVEGYQ
eukprot:1739606-Pleurochrysis_carterae.AAC.1